MNVTYFSLRIFGSGSKQHKTVSDTPPYTWSSVFPGGEVAVLIASKGFFLIILSYHPTTPPKFHVCPYVYKVTSHYTQHTQTGAEYTTIKEMKNDDDDQTVSLKLTTSFVSQKTFALLFPRIVMRYHEILKNEFHCLCYPRSTI